MGALTQAITRGLTTAQGTNIQAVILISLAFVNEMPAGSTRNSAFFVTLLVWVFVSFITRGHEALSPRRVDEPLEDLDHDLPLDDVLAEGRAFTGTPLVAQIPRAVSSRCISLVKEFEGCRLTAYWDKWGKVWTIGYGWTRGVKKGDKWTQAQADKMLFEGIKPYAAAVQAAVGNSPTTQGAFDAMTSFAYNVGPANFRKSSVLRFHLKGDKSAAGNAFLAWNKAGGKVLPGLTRRRQAERKLYLT